jgi:outer membrane lipoprotein-sorting protein
MARRLVQGLLFVTAAVVLSACSGAEAKRAQELLAKANAAQAKVVSASYDVRVVVSAGSQRYSMLMHGGGYFKGPRAGDQFMTMRGEGLPVPMNFQLVSKGGRAVVRANGRTQSFPMPSGATGSQTSNWTAIVGDLAKYVKEVDVQESTVVAGTRGRTVTGVIDTAGLVKAAAGMNIFSQAAGAGSAAFDEMTKNLGDTRVVLFIANRTHLIRTAVITLELKAAGEGAKVQVFYSLRGVNRPIAFPGSN